MANLLLLLLSSLLFLQDIHGLCVPRPSYFRAKKTVQPSASVPQPVSGSSSIRAPPSASASPSVRAPPSASASPSVNASVVVLCKKSSYPDICVSAVQPYLPASGQVGAKDMLVMHVNASRSRLGQANAEAHKALGDTTISPEERSCLETCLENYDDSNSSLDAGLDAMAKSDGATLNVMLSAALTDVGTCDDGYSDFPGLTSPLAGYDEELQHLISNCLYFGTIL